MRKIFVLVIIIFAFVMNFDAIAQLGAGANFLKMGVGSRPLGMGSAFTGVGDDLYTMYWNPGGLGLVRWWEVSAMYNSYFADMYYGALTGVKQFRMLGSRKTTAGIGLFFHGMPEWDNTQGASPERGSANNIMAVAAFGQRLDWLWDDISLGLNVKVGRSSLANYDAWTFAADFGIMYQLDVFNRPLQIGATVQNIGHQTAFIRESSPIPLGFRLGVSYRFLNCDYHNLLIATDIAKYKYGNLKLSLGAEYWFWNLLAIRSGYVINQKDIGDLSFGMSVKFDAFNSGLQTDYNRSNYGEVFNYNNSGTVSLFAVNPEPFRLLAPEEGMLFCHKEIVKLAWEDAPDPDQCDIVHYRILIDPDRSRVENAIADLGVTASTSRVFLDLNASENELNLPELIPNKYFWTTIAIDRRGHSRWCEEIWSFIIGAPDLIIRDLTFLPSDTLPNLNDNFQGTIRIIVENKGPCPAFNFNIILSDSFCCASKNFAEEFIIDSLGPRQTVNRYYTWWTDLIG
ncbi:MAG TPA: PorV/PorQ family protein, partial [bacterium]